MWPESLSGKFSVSGNPVSLAESRQRSEVKPCARRCSRTMTFDSSPCHLRARNIGKRRKDAMRDKMPKVGMLARILGVFAAGAVAYPCSRAPHEIMQLYYVQDMLAGLLLFSVASIVVAVVILILFLLDEGLHRAVAHAGPYMVRTAVRLLWCCGQLGRLYFHRSKHPVAR